MFKLTDMRRTQFSWLLASALLLASCEFKCQVGKDTSNNDQKTVVQSSNNSNETKTLNGIQISSKTIQVNQAFLALESGELVPSNNTVSLGEKIVLTINSNGWKNVDGKSFIGINQTITTNTGAVVLDTGDMFAKYDETGINAEYANMLKLKANITETKPEIEYFTVTFRVWDKKGHGEITGSYKFFVK